MRQRYGLHAMLITPRVGFRRIACCGATKIPNHIPHSAAQRRPLAPREELSVRLADALTPFEGCGRGEGLGLLLRSKRATLLAQASRAWSKGGKGRLAAQGAPNTTIGSTFQAGFLSPETWLATYSCIPKKIASTMRPMRMAMVIFTQLSGYSPVILPVLPFTVTW